MVCHMIHYMTHDAICRCTMIYHEIWLFMMLKYDRWGYLKLRCDALNHPTWSCKIGPRPRDGHRFPIGFRGMECGAWWPVILQPRQVGFSSPLRCTKKFLGQKSRRNPHEELSYLWGKGWDVHRSQQRPLAIIGRSWSFHLGSSKGMSWRFASSPIARTSWICLVCICHYPLVMTHRAVENHHVYWVNRR